jgi:hypothetical protein
MQHRPDTTPSDFDNLKNTVRDNDMSILFNVTIAPGEYTKQSRYHMIRFQVDTNGTTYNIPVFKGGKLASKDNYYDVYSFAKLNNINDKDSALIYVENYSNKVMDLYYKLNVHVVTGGLPNRGKFVRTILLNGVEAVFIPDSNQVYSQYWKIHYFRNLERLTDSLYVSKVDK